MKKIFITFALLFTLLVSGKSQDAVRYLGTKYATCEYANNSWSDWTEWTDCFYSIYFIAEKNTIKFISSDYTQTIFTIVDWNKYFDSDNNTNYKFDCIDSDGDKCNIRFKYFQDGEIHCFVVYEYNKEFVYLCKALD